MTLSARWDGGTGSCPDFALNWHNPGLSWETEFDFLAPDVYP